MPSGWATILPATDLLQVGGAYLDGRFLVRERTAGDYDEYILSVGFRGKATHHLLKRDAPGKPFTLNKKVMGDFKTIATVRSGVYCTRSANASHLKQPFTGRAMYSMQAADQFPSLVAIPVPFQPFL